MFDLTLPWPRGVGRRTIWYLVAAFIVLLFGLYWVDVPLAQWAKGLSRDVRGGFVTITDYGRSEWILVPAGGLCLVSYLLSRWIPNWSPRLALWQTAQISGFIFVGVGLPGLVCNLFKRLVGRGRPRVFDEVGPLSFHNVFNDSAFQSFPSGHTTTAFAFALVIGFLAPRSLPLGLFAAAAVAVSRVIVGAHYPTDVLAGMVLGVLGAYAVRNVFAARRWVFQTAANGRISPRPPAAILRLLRGSRLAGQRATPAQRWHR